VTRLRSSATHRFWKLFSRLPGEVQDLAIAKNELFRQSPFHPSLGLQEKGRVWTVDIGRSYRAIALRNEDQLTWFWIGSHEEYNRVLSRVK